MRSPAPSLAPDDSPGWTPEARRLLEPERELGLPVPAYGGRSLANVVPAAIRALELRISAGPELAPSLDRELDPFEGGAASGPVLVLLVDAMGWFPYARWAGGQPRRAAGPWGRARPITSVFPSTTVAALPSLSSGTPPGRHGVVAPLLYVPELGTVIDVLRM